MNAEFWVEHCGRILIPMGGSVPGNLHAEFWVEHYDGSLPGNLNAKFWVEHCGGILRVAFFQVICMLNSGLNIVGAVFQVI